MNDFFDNCVAREFFDHVCGKLIGYGISRWVFDYNPDPSCVIKIESQAASFQNVHEWDLWKQHHDSGPAGTALCKWLAPCVSISHSGSVLVQKKTKPLPIAYKLPKMIPNVLNDLKEENWGLYKNRLVCHDYGRHDAVSEASRGQNMQRAKWINAVNGHFKVFETGETRLNT